jgi:hypothetical protein
MGIQVSPSTWANLKSTKTSIHFCIPRCRPSGSEDPDEMFALAEAITQKGHSFTVYLAHYTSEEISLWKKNNKKLVEKYPHSISDLNDWRKSDRWIKANKNYLDLLEGRKGKKKETLEKLLQADIKKVQERPFSVNFSLLDIRNHIIEDVSDCASWMEPLDEQPSDIQNVLIYAHSLTQLMYNLIDPQKGVAQECGLKKGSLQRVKPKFNVVQQSAKDELNQDQIMANIVKSSSYKDTVALFSEMAIRAEYDIDKTIEMLRKQSETVVKKKFFSEEQNDQRMIGNERRLSTVKEPVPTVVTIHAAINQKQNPVVQKQAGVELHKPSLANFSGGRLFPTPSLVSSSIISQPPAIPSLVRTPSPSKVEVNN